MPLHLKLLGAFGLVLAIGASESAVAYYTSLENLRSNAWVTHTNKVLTIAGEASAALFEMKASYRGFLLAGDETLIGPYEAGRQTYPERLVALEQLTTDNPPQVARWQELERRVVAWEREVVEPGIALRREVAAGQPLVPEVLAVVSGGLSQRHIDGMQQIFDEAIATEENLLGQRSATNEALNARLVDVLRWGTLAFITLGLVIASAFARSLARAVARVRASEQQYRQMFENNQAIKLLIDPSSGAIVDANTAACVFYEYPREELLQRNITDLHTRPADQVEGDLAHAEAGQRGHFEFRHRRAGGDVRDVEVYSGPINVAGRALLFSIIHDVTDRKQAEEERAALLVRDEASRTKDELVSVVSHELRTPLASVVGFAELLRDREYPEHQRRQFLTVIIEEGRRLTALINDFLDLQRLESAGRQHLTLGSTALRPLVEHAILAAGADSERPLVLDAPDDLPPVRVDADRFHQVLGNLLSNARKYSPAGGAVHVSLSETKGEVWISIHDEGLGIPPAALPHLFKKFYRVDNSDRRSIKGTGLGLAICKQLIEAHGGSIRVESAGLGRGSTFSFSLRKACPEPTVGDVLVVEDDTGFARLLDVELAEHGLSSVWVASAEQALTHVEVGLSRLVVLDLMLPGLSGEAFLRRLREVGGADIPVVVVTAKDLSTEERAVLQQLRVAGVFRKGPDAARTAARFIASLTPTEMRRAA